MAKEININTVRDIVKATEEVRKGSERYITSQMEQKCRVKDCSASGEVVLDDETVICLEHHDKINKS